MSIAHIQNCEIVSLYLFVQVENFASYLANAVHNLSLVPESHQSLLPQKDRFTVSFSAPSLVRSPTASLYLTLTTLFSIVPVMIVPVIVCC